MKRSTDGCYRGAGREAKRVSAPYRLTDEAQRARDEVRDFLGVIDATARHFEEMRAARAEVASAVGL